MFEAMHSEWARDFLFRSDSLCDAQIISSPLQMTNSISLSMRGSSDPYGIPECFVNMLLIPAFNVDHFCALYVVEGNGNPEPDGDSKRQNVSLARCVRNDVTGSITIVSQNKEKGYLEIDVIAMVSTSKSFRAHMQFDARRFFHAFNLFTGVIDFSNVEAALVSSMIGTCISRCVLCSASLHEPCLCKIDFKPARHPLSFENNALHSLFLIGDFQTTFTMTSFGSRTKPTSIYKGYCISMSGTPFGIADRLHSWALCSLINAQPVNPLQLCLPEDAAHSIDPSVCPSLDLPAGIDLLEDHDPITPGYTGTEQLAIENQTCDDGFFQSSILASADPFQEGTANSSHSEKSGAQNFDDIIYQSSRDLVQGEYLPHTAEGSLANEQEVTFAAPPQVQSVSAGTSESSEVLKVTVGAGNIPNSSRSTEDCRKRQTAVHIAPAPALPFNGNSVHHGTAEVSEGVAYLAKVEADRLAKIELRKIRKREAAARSNACRRRQKLQQRQKMATATNT